MQGTRVAARYAKSFIGLTMEQGVFEEAHKDMQYVSEVCESNKDFVIFLKSPVIKTDKKQAVLKQIFTGKLNKITDAYIQLITAKKREMYLAEIANEFINQYKEIYRLEEEVKGKSLEIIAEQRQRMTSYFEAMKVKCKELKRGLAQQGATFQTGKVRT